MLVMPIDHPLANQPTITLSDLATCPLITYHPSFTGRTKVDAAFAQAKLSPRIALEAIDSDVIKTYVGLGLGIGIVAEMALDKSAQESLHIRPAGHLFGTNTAKIAFKRGTYIRNFVYHFVNLMAPALSKLVIDRAMLSSILN
jgi:LysR family cys regulon transcriptional activator